MGPRFVVISAITGFAMFAATAHTVSGPVERSRVERFARRQRLAVTVTNGAQIIRYLATTRRWRAAGLVVGLVLSVGPHFPAEVRVDFVTLFAGWFVGALVAEVRVAHLGYGQRRAARLQRRRPSSYLPRSAWMLLPAAAAVAVAVGLATAVAAAAGRAYPDWTAAFWLVVALAVAATVRAIQMLVLRRPQPLAEPDVLAADDAVRSRSLHVLAGGGAALVLLCVFAQLASLRPLSAGVAETIGAVRALGVFAVAAVGWSVATSAWPARPDAPGAAAAEAT